MVRRNEAGMHHHPNPANPPAGFPRNVPERVHEHVYVEGLDLRCARPLEDQAIVNHAHMFRTFCGMTRLTFEPPYAPPPLIQPRLDLT
jgi:hypothetical protein